MCERQPPRVQRLPLERTKHFGEYRVGDPRPVRLTVRRVTDNRPPARRQMHSNLMRPACAEPAA
jgi:hypothetical protein